MKITDAMTSKVITAGPQASISEVARLMAENGISGIPIVDTKGAVLGIITERDLLPKMKGVPFSRIKLPALFGEWLDDHEFEKAISAAKDRKAEEVMSKSIVSVDANDELGRAAALMSEHGIKRLPVLQDGALVGIVTRADIIRAISS